MHWLTILVLGCLTAALQTTLAPRVAIAGARPDWLLAVTLYVALHAERRRAIASGWLMGFLGDLLTIEPMGRLTLSYGLVALGTTSVRHFLFRRHMITSFVLTLVAALLLRSAWAVHRLIAEEEFLAHTGEVLAAGAGESLHTAVWAVLIHQGLLRLPLARSSRSLALESPP